MAGNDEREFARQVDRLLDAPDERARMGEIGRQRVATALAWEFSVPPLVRAYREGLELAPRMPDRIADATDRSGRA